MCLGTLRGVMRRRAIVCHHFSCGALYQTRNPELTSPVGARWRCRRARDCLHARPAVDDSRHQRQGSTVRVRSGTNDSVIFAAFGATGWGSRYVVEDQAAPAPSPGQQGQNTRLELVQGGHLQVGGSPPSPPPRNGRSSRSRRHLGLVGHEQPGPAGLSVRCDGPRHQSGLRACSEAAAFQAHLDARRSQDQGYWSDTPSPTSWGTGNAQLALRLRRRHPHLTRTFGQAWSEATPPGIRCRAQ